MSSQEKKRGMLLLISDASNLEKKIMATNKPSKQKNNGRKHSVTTDGYQESHLAHIFITMPRGMHIFLALFSGSMSTVLYLNRDEIIAQPMLRLEGFLLFQILMFGIFLMSFYHVLWAKPRGHIEQGKVFFSWWGFWLRDLFLALVFFPFAVIMTRMPFSGSGKGLFIDLGGLNALFDANTPIMQRAILAVVTFIILLVLLGIAFIPIWLTWRSLVNLFIQLKYGTSTALFDSKSYAPGETLTVKITNASNLKPSAPRRVFINLLERPIRASAPPSSKGYHRNYLYSEFQDVTVRDLEQDLSFVLPNALMGKSITSQHQGPGEIRYWEILVEEPQRMYWARFLFLVE